MAEPVPTEITDTREEPRHCADCTKLFIVKTGSRRLYCDTCMATRMTNKGRADVGGRPRNAGGAE